MAKQVLTKLFMSVQFFSFFHLGKINMFITLKAYKTSTVLQGCKNTFFFLSILYNKVCYDLRKKYIHIEICLM